MIKPKITRITVNISVGMKEKIIELMNKMSLMTQTDVVNAAILNLYRKEFKDYVESKVGPKMTLDEKVEFDLKRKEIKN